MSRPEAGLVALSALELDFSGLGRKIQRYGPTRSTIYNRVQ